ncbi:MAG: carbohydrate-binding domain-containing protein, partial [Lachnospiraceae bacterium]|nr:carbohydrate-binding domain-containing protein [Lachnospiraceae bacterium]
MQKKRYQMIAAICALSLCVISCGNTTELNEAVNAAVKESELFSDRDLSGEYDAAACDSITLSDAGCTTDSKNVTIDKSVVTITGEGDYILNGTLRDGRIVVDVEKSEKVQLVLNGVDVTSSTSAAIYVKSADKVFITLADGTNNTLANGGTFVAVDDNNIDAVIFSKDDLTLNGTGGLSVKSPAGHGIVSKNDLVITNGTYEITASSHGITGKDSVAVADGNYRITAGKSAIKSVNDDDLTQGSVSVTGGTFTLSAGTDGINAMNEINILDGKIVIAECNEGLEARVINLSGGEIEITAQDDGLNATDKRTDPDVASAADAKNTQEKIIDQADVKDNFRGGRGGMDQSHSEASINISGGLISIDAEGDGVDSNGYFYMSGGELYVTGPTSGGNGALDYDIEASISGGIVVAAGQSGMAQNFGSDSTQGAILVNTQEQNAAGSDIVLLDSEGKELLARTIHKRYNSVVVSCPEIKDGNSYTVMTGDRSTAVTMEGLIYGENIGFGGAKQGFKKGERPEGTPEAPEMKSGERPEGMPKAPEMKNCERPKVM